MLPEQIKRFIIESNSGNVKEGKIIDRPDVNMDAYNAYFSEQEPQTNEIHINQVGANINITTGQNCLNNFIFNHTAPINLNFYKDTNGNETRV